MQKKQICYLGYAFMKKKNYNAADILYKTLDKASKGFRLKINEPEWIEMPNNASPKDWTDTAEDYIGNGKDKYSFAIFPFDVYFC